MHSTCEGRGRNCSAAGLQVTHPSMERIGVDHHFTRYLCHTCPYTVFNL